MCNLQVGDIILLKPEKQDVTGKMIAEATKSEFCHAVMVYSVKKNDKGHKKEDKIRVIELNINGVQVTKKTAVESAETDFNGYVMRLKDSEQSQLLLKQTAKDMRKRAIGFDVMGLFVLEEFYKIRQSLHFDQEGLYGSADILLIAAEFVNLVKQINLANKDMGIYEEKMHCIQFIYNLFYESGASCRIHLDGGFFLSDADMAHQSKVKYTPNPGDDKIDYLSGLLRSRLSDEVPPWMKYLSFLSPMYNGKQRKAALLQYHAILESDIPIASSLITAEDFIKHASNLQHVGYYTIK